MRGWDPFNEPELGEDVVNADCDTRTCYFCYLTADLRCEEHGPGDERAPWLHPENIPLRVRNRHDVGCPSWCKCWTSHHHARIIWWDARIGCTHAVVVVGRGKTGLTSTFMSLRMPFGVAFSPPPSWFTQCTKWLCSSGVQRSRLLDMPARRSAKITPSCRSLRRPSVAWRV